MTPLITLRQQELVDSYALVELAVDAPDALQIARATVCGPFCQYSRTLPTQFEFSVNPHSVGAQCTIIDPCYWTPALPFLYKLKVHWRHTDGQELPTQHQIGLRRLVARESSLYWEGRRVVLRGTFAVGPSADLIATARSNDLTLVASNAPEEFYDLADRHGIPVIADLRPTAPDIDLECLVRLASRPSVVAILIDGMQLYSCSLGQIPIGCFLAVAVYPEDELAAREPPSWSDIVAVMIDSAHRPPHELAKCGKPIIALELGESSGDLSGARDGCERLQARLAPEFNLAGYVVGIPDV